MQVLLEERAYTRNSRIKSDNAETTTSDTHHMPRIFCLIFWHVADRAADTSGSYKFNTSKNCLFAIGVEKSDFPFTFCYKFLVGGAISHGET